MHRAFKSSCLERLECLEYLGQSKRTDYSRLTIRTQTNVTQEKKTWAARLLDSEVDKFNSGPTIDSNSNYETRETWQELKPTWHSLNRENRNTKKRKPKKKKTEKKKVFIVFFDAWSHVYAPSAKEHNTMLYNETFYYFFRDTVTVIRIVWCQCIEGGEKSRCVRTEKRSKQDSQTNDENRSTKPQSQGTYMQLGNSKY